MRELYVKVDALIEEAQSFLAANRTFYGGIRVRCVTTAKDGKRQCAVWVVQAFPEGQVPPQEKSIEYREVHLLESWLNADEVMPFLNHLKSGAIKVGGEEATCDLIEQTPCWALLASRNDHSPLPGRRYMLRANGNLSINSPFLLEYGLPFHEGIYEAMGKWSGIAKASEVGSGFTGSGILFLPECRARIVGTQRDGNRLTVAVEAVPEALDGLRIQGAFGSITPREHWPIGADVAGSGVTLEIQEGADFVTCYLIGPDGTVFDYFREGPTWHEGMGPVLRGGLNPSNEEVSRLSVVEDAIASGEGEQVEYKEFVNPTDLERVEAVARAVMAFLNTSGGRVFIGIDNKCQVVGVDEGLRKAGYLTATDTPEPIERYAGFLRQQIAEVVVPSVAIDFDVVEYRGRRVVVLTVPPGDDRPYHRRDQNIVYIRKGATNRPADPRTELPAFYQKESNVFPW